MDFTNKNYKDQLKQMKQKLKLPDMMAHTYTTTIWEVENQKFNVALSDIRPRLKQRHSI